MCNAFVGLEEMELPVVRLERGTCEIRSLPVASVAPGEGDV